jgi:hypothetical protein
MALGGRLPPSAALSSMQLTGNGYLQPSTGVLAALEGVAGGRGTG